MDTKTPRTPDPSGRRPGGSVDSQQGGSGGLFGDDPGLSTVKVPSDPAEVVVTHASFRVQLAPSADGSSSASGAATGGFPWTSGVAAPGVTGTGTGTGTGHESPATGASVLWGVGETEETGATRLSPVARPDGRQTAESAASTTQVLPRIDEETVAAPSTLIGQRGHGSSHETARPQPSSLLHGARPVHGAFDGPEPGTRDPYGPYDPYGQRGGYGGEFGSEHEPAYGQDHLREYGTGQIPGYGDEDADLDAYGQRPLADGEFDDTPAHGSAVGTAPSAGRRQAYYPGRRLNLGVVLLPMRIFLGFISVYAGMGKLCDPVYFDGDARGSMVTWLRSLEPWALASPLRDFALAHPVGSGLTVAFLQIIIGVLTVCGLWQRLAASVGALLSAALLMTVSWSSGPAYETPDIIYLAAWSPLVIAGAPVYSVDGKLAADAWRKLGPRAELLDLRRQVLRRGAVIASVVTGVAMLLGAMLGGAVRASHTATVPDPDEPPTNRLPGSPLPTDPDAGTSSDTPAGGHAQGADGGPGSRRSGGPSSPASQDGGQRSDPSGPTQHETVQAPEETGPGAGPPQQSDPGTQATQGGGGSSGTSGGSSAGGGTGGSSNSGGGGGSSSSGGSGGGGGSSYSGGGGLGGLLG